MTLTSLWRSVSWRLGSFGRQLQMVADLVLLSIAFWFAYLLRFDFEIPHHEWIGAAIQLPYVVLLQFLALIASGVYTYIWRFIGLTELKSFVNAAVCAGVPVLLLRFLLPDSLVAWRVPLSIIVMDAFLGFGMILGARVLRRLAYERSSRRRSTTQPTGRRKAILLIGAGHVGMLAARELQSRGSSELIISGFVDDDPEKQGAVVHGVKVLGRTTDLPTLVQRLAIDHVVITLDHAAGREVRRIVEICDRAAVKARMVPDLSQILAGTIEVSRIRDVQVEDLLGRTPVRLEEHAVREFLAGKTVMVTGAGGSIGSELARQVAGCEPACLLLIERAEFALFSIDRELKEASPRFPILALVADIGDIPRMSAIFSTYSPQIVLHAAAHKHVPLMELNPSEAIKNNVLATRELGELAGRSGAETFVLISTDKAVRPRSLMGASKRVAELVVQDLNRRHPTRFVAVRFGNVIGSAGSVIPIFQEQIRKGGPVTVTHPEMIRYFMTIPEAAQLVLQAGALGEGGEIFILDMGEPVRILDLAKATILLSGLKPFEDVDIVFTGPRAGEKLFEELQMTGEEVTRTRHPMILIGNISSYPRELVDRSIEALTELARPGRERELYTFLNELLPEAQLEFDGKRTPVRAPALPAAANEPVEVPYAVSLRSIG